jgi:L-ascorbate metabolism protein UlaG (beta-lactamase superfamily)
LCHASRFVGLTPPDQSPAVTIGLNVHVLRARHNSTRRWPEEPVAFLVEDSQTVLHTGDADLTPENSAALRSLPRVDIAVIPYWHLLNATTPTKTIAPVIRPVRLVRNAQPPNEAGRGFAR